MTKEPTLTVKHCGYCSEGYDGNCDGVQCESTAYIPTDYNQPHSKITNRITPETCGTEYATSQTDTGKREEVCKQYSEPCYCCEEGGVDRAEHFISDHFPAGCRHKAKDSVLARVRELHAKAIADQKDAYPQYSPITIDCLNEMLECIEEMSAKNEGLEKRNEKILDMVYSGYFGTKNRVHLIQLLSPLS